MRIVCRAVRSRLGLRVLIAIVTLALVAGSPDSAFAHANLEEAEPAPNKELEDAPERIVLRFSESLAPAFSEIQVLNVDGDRVDNRDSSVPRDDLRQMTVTLPPLPDGTYTVSWQNVSAVDGHGLRGWYVFSVGEPLDAEAGLTDEAPALTSPFDPIVRWMALIGALGLAGGLLFDRAIGRPALDRMRENSASLNLRAAHERWIRRLLVGGAVLWAAGTLLQLPVQLAIVTGEPVHRAGLDGVSALLVDTSWGRAWLARTALIAASGYLLWRWLRGSSGTGALVLAVLGALFSMSAASHGAALSGLGPAGLTNDFLHLVAASTWVGGLFALVVFVRETRTHLGAEERRLLLRQVLPRFSVLAVLSVGVLMLTGLFMAWMHVHEPDAVWTPYGWTLVVKTTLFLTMLAIGAVNLLWTPRENERSEAGSRWLGRLVSVEAAIAVLVILAAGVMTSMEPARSAAAARAGERTFVETVDDVTATLRVSPGGLGANRLTVLMEDRQGTAIDAHGVSLRVSYLESDIGDLTLDAERVEAGRYEASGARLGVSGNWRVQVVAARPDGFDVRAGFVVPMGEAAQGAGAALPIGAGRVLWIAQWIALGALFHGMAWRIRGRHRTAMSAFQWTGTACLVMVIFVGTNTMPFRLEAPMPDVNPLPASAEVVGRGEELFQQHCAVCHGPEGRGDGPQASELPRAPDDLRIHVPMHSDRQLFGFIRDGIPQAGMPAFEGMLTEEDTWSVLHYLRANFDDDMEMAEAEETLPWPEATDENGNDGERGVEEEEDEHADH